MDLISRQAAIDALKVCVTIGRGNGKSVAFKIANDYADIVRKRIETLPSAQPDTKAQLFREGTTFDCVSRQDAIDRITKAIWDDKVAHDVKEILKNLPSAQPEQRKNGMWINKKKRWSTWCVDAYECSVCGDEGLKEWRFCPNCGADMRGEQK